MRFDKFTIKSQELIKNSQALAAQYNNQQIEPEHLLAAMLAEKEGVINYVRFDSMDRSGNQIKTYLLTNSDGGSIRPSCRLKPPKT